MHAVQFYIKYIKFIIHIHYIQLLYTCIICETMSSEANCFIVKHKIYSSFIHRAVARALTVRVNIHVFVLCWTNFFLNQG